MATKKRPAGAKRTGAKKAAAKKASVGAKSASAKRARARRAAAKRAAAARAKLVAEFNKKLTPGELLAEVIGYQPMTRTEVIRRLWMYIKEHRLQDRRNRRMINADERLALVFGKRQVNMFEMTKLVSAQLT